MLGVGVGEEGGCTVFTVLRVLGVGSAVVRALKLLCACAWWGGWTVWGSLCVGCSVCVACVGCGINRPACVEAFVCECVVGWVDGVGLAYAVRTSA